MKDFWKALKCAASDSLRGARPTFGHVLSERSWPAQIHSVNCKTEWNNLYCLKLCTSALKQCQLIWHSGNDSIWLFRIWRFYLYLNVSSGLLSFLCLFFSSLLVRLEVVRVATRDNEIYIWQIREGNYFLRFCRL